MSNDTLTYPFAAPADGTGLRISDEIIWLRLPLPFALDHVNLWLLQDNDAQLLIDCGLNSQRMRDLWPQLLAEFASTSPIRSVLVTHYHPDHMGAAGWLVPQLKARFYASRAEWLQARMFALDSNFHMESAARYFFESCGLPDNLVAELLARGNSYALGVAIPPANYVRLKMGDRLNIHQRAWQIMAFGGHSPEHLCLYQPQLNTLIAGDQVLPRISPNVSVWVFEPEANPLADYLFSLEHLRQLPEQALVLPSHGKPFYGLHQRLDVLKQHHQERLVQCLAFCREPKNAAEVMQHLFPRALDKHQTLFAIGEALAHLNYLWHSGQMQRHNSNAHTKAWQFQTL